MYNEIRAEQFARTTNQQFHMYLAVDKVEKQRVMGNLRLCLSRVHSKESRESLGRLPLLPGMPVLINENLCISSKVVHSSEGILTDVIYKSTTEGREALCAFVKVPSLLLDLEGLEPFVILVFPRTTQFSYRTVTRESIKISCMQLPLLPAWGFMDYKVQGTSMKKVIIDLASARGVQNAYVMLSRVTSL